MSWKAVKTELGKFAQNPLRPFELAGEQLGVIDSNETKQKKGSQVVVPGYGERVATGNLAAEEREKQRQADKDAYLKSLDLQVAAFEQAPKEVEKQREDAIKALRYNQAQAASQGRGLLGGGAGLAATRQMARERAVGEGTIRQQATQALLDAQQRAAAASTERFAAREELRQAEDTRLQQITDMQAQIDAIIESDEPWYTKKDKMRRLRDASQDPQIRAMLTQAINSF